MPELKTRKTTASVQAFLKKAAKGDRYEACQFLLVTFEKATKDKPRCRPRCSATHLEERPGKRPSHGRIYETSGVRLKFNTVSSVTSKRSSRAW